MISLSDTLSIAIGLISIYLLFSIIVSYLLELISSLFNLRSANLANAIHGMLDPSATTLAGVEQVKKTWSDASAIADHGIVAEAKLVAGNVVAKTELVSSNIAARRFNENPVKAFYTHPIIKTLSKPNKLPSYIQPRDFSNVLLDLLSKAGTQDPTQTEDFLTRLRRGIDCLDNSALKEALVPLIQNAEFSEQTTEKKIARARSNVEGWFNNTMDRATGWYKRTAVKIAILVGLIIALLLNIDTLTIVQSLWANSSLRQAFSSAAVAYIQQGKDQSADQALLEVRDMNLPLGWNGRLADANPQTPLNPQEIPILPGEISLKVLGVLITGLAISQGSSIWFDLLQVLLKVNPRTTGEKPQPAVPLESEAN